MDDMNVRGYFSRIPRRFGDGLAVSFQFLFSISVLLFCVNLYDETIIAI
jgi:hypothetical protein